MTGRARINPRRLAAVLIVAAVGGWLVVRLATPAAVPGTALPSAASGAPIRSPATAVSSPSTQVSTVATPDNVPAGSPPAAEGPTNPAVAAAARGFAQAWTRHTGADAGTWHARTARWCTPQLAGRLAGVDPAAVPASTVPGPARPLAVRPGGWADAAVTTDAGTLRLQLRHTDRWRIDAIDWTPAR